MYNNWSFRCTYTAEESDDHGGDAKGIGCGDDGGGRAPHDTNDGDEEPAFEITTRLKAGSFHSKCLEGKKEKKKSGTGSKTSLDGGAQVRRAPALGCCTFYIAHDDDGCNNMHIIRGRGGGGGAGKLLARHQQ